MKTKSIIAGILSILGGAFGLFDILRRVLDPSNIGIIGRFFNIGYLVLPIMIAQIIICVLAIIGGIFAFKHKLWGLALAGSIAAIFAAWPLGIVALIFTIVSRKEFK